MKERGRKQKKAREKTGEKGRKIFLVFSPSPMQYSMHFFT